MARRHDPGSLEPLPGNWQLDHPDSAIQQHAEVVESATTEQVGRNTPLGHECLSTRGEFLLFTRLTDPSIWYNYSHILPLVWRTSLIPQPRRAALKVGHRRKDGRQHVSHPEPGTHDQLTSLLGRTSEQKHFTAETKSALAMFHKEYVSSPTSQPPTRSPSASISSIPRS